MNPLDTVGVDLPEAFDLPHHAGMRLFCFMVVWAMNYRPVKRGTRVSNWVKLKRTVRPPNQEASWKARLGKQEWVEGDEGSACSYAVANNIPDRLVTLLLQGGYLERKPQKGVALLDLEPHFMHVRATEKVLAAVLVVEEGGRREREARGR